ncbi:MAG: hypothetical protein KGL39_34045 [Patescibacteria group bacterium]|nr:hypothetical protein [Patescibacteria group bacterium]
MKTSKNSLAKPQRERGVASSALLDGCSFHVKKSDWKKMPPKTRRALCEMVAALSASIFMAEYEVGAHKLPEADEKCLAAYEQEQPANASKLSHDAGTK